MNDPSDPHPSRWMPIPPQHDPSGGRLCRLNLEDWRSTPRTVSLQEITEKVNPVPPRVAADGKYSEFSDYARVHSLLMREECLSPLRKGLREYLEQREVPPSVPMYGPVLRFERFLPTGTGLWVVVQFQWRSRPLRTNLWYGNLLYFVSDGELLTTATVRSKSHSPEDKCTQVTIELGGLVDEMMDILLKIVASPSDIFIIEDPSYYRALEPAIRHLQENESCPLWGTLGVPP